MHLKMSSGKWRPFCLGLNVFNTRRPGDAYAHEENCSTIGSGDVFSPVLYQPITQIETIF